MGRPAKETRELLAAMMRRVLANDRSDPFASHGYLDLSKGGELTIDLTISLSAEEAKLVEDLTWDVDPIHLDDL